MKQPSGPAVRASPMPATSARVKKSSSMAAAALRMRVVVIVMLVMMIVPVAMVVMVPVIGMAMVGDRPVLMQHPPVRQVGVIVVVAVERERSFRPRAEQAHIFRAGDDRVRRAAAADMAVEADHRVGR